MVHLTTTFTPLSIHYSFYSHPLSSLSTLNFLGPHTSPNKLSPSQGCYVSILGIVLLIYITIVQFYSLMFVIIQGRCIWSSLLEPIPDQETWISTLPWTGVLLLWQKKTLLLEGLWGPSPAFPLEIATSPFQCSLIPSTLFLAHTFLSSRCPAGNSHLCVLPDMNPKYLGNTSNFLSQDPQVSGYVSIVLPPYLLHG